MIFDQKNSFSQEDFQVFRDTCPMDGWKDAVVFSRTDQKDVLQKTVRNGNVVKETDRDKITTYKRIVLRKLLPWLRAQPSFQYCYFRPHHVEWLRYEKNMYFQQHKDFERYKCNGMIPYVALVGLVDTESGGQTRVEGRDLIGGCSENGLAFFPSNVFHESRPVLKGCKICLKLEFFVFMEESYIQVSDDRQQWRSFWSAEELALVDNYISVHSDFLKTKNVVTSTEMARSIHNMMIHIADPRQCYGLDAETMDMLFPSASGIFLHDLFVAYRFIREKGPAHQVVLLRDAKAWDYVNAHMELPENVELYCGLWYKEKDNKRYQFHSARDRAGNILHGWSMKKATDEFCDFDLIRVRLIKHFIETFDMASHEEPPKPVTLKKAKTTVIVHNSRILETVSPSDYVQTPVKRSGKITETEREFCNDADSGYETYTYRRYTTFYIQVRWCMFLR